MNQRRTFLQKLGMGLTLSGLWAMDLKEENNFYINPNLPEPEFWKKVRESFPLTRGRVYFNNGTFGPAPYPVLKKLEDVNIEICRSGEYGHTDGSREKLAEFLNIGADELCLTHNTTEGINIMAWGLALKAGDEVIITNHDHVGNALPWLNRAKLHGIVLKPFTPKNTQEENLTLIQSLCSPKTKVIAIPHITCTTGLVFPIKAISDFARSKGIYTAIDGAHGAGTFNLNLHDLGCDFYAGCLHKWFLGPSGTGFLYVKKELIEDLQAIQVGAYSDSGWDVLSNPPRLDGYNPTAHRYDYGTQSTALYAGAEAAAAFLTEIGKQKIEDRIRFLNDRLFTGIQSIGTPYEILTPAEKASRLPMMTFRSKKTEFKTLGTELGNAGFRVRQIHEANLNAIRISTHIYNSEEEIDRLIAVLQKLV